MLGPNRKTPPNKPKPGQKLGWTNRVEKFCEAMAVEDSITAAAIKAGYAKSSAPFYGSKLMAREDVCLKIKEIKATRKTAFKLDIERLDREVQRLALFDVRKLYKEDGTLIPIHELDDDTAAAIAAVEVYEEFAGKGEDRIRIGVTKKYKVTDKNAAINTAMRRLGAFEVDNSQQVNPLAEAMKFFANNGRTRFTPGAR